MLIGEIVRESDARTAPVDPAHPACRRSLKYVFTTPYLARCACTHTRDGDPVNYLHETHTIVDDELFAVGIFY
jgi:hypothetical protein